MLIVVFVVLCVYYIHELSCRWGLPYAYFELGGNCSPSHFSDHQIIINLTFCGDWAGSVFDQRCGSVAKGADCRSFVANNPSLLAESYFLIEYVKVFRQV